MIRYVTGNLLEADVQALVNTVNTVGAMGKGIALQFKEVYPENFTAYERAVKNGEIRIGNMFVTAVQRLDGTKILINFPTKEHWIAPSRYEWIESGLKSLVALIEETKIKSIAIPPLGCGNGKLKWEKVRAMMEQYLQPLHEVEILIFSPNEKIQAILGEENKKKETKLTPVRAELLYLLFHYEASGEETSLFIANKLSYFLQRLGDKQLNLTFQRHLYGPYANQVDHLMYALNGTYIRGLEQRTAKAFDPLRLVYDKYEEVKLYVAEYISPKDQERLNVVLHLISGFQSPLSMEVLATVDAILESKPNLNAQEVFVEIQNWSDRKSQLIKPHQVEAAYSRIQEFARELGHARTRE